MHFCFSVIFILSLQMSVQLKISQGTGLLEPPHSSLSLSSFIRAPSLAAHASRVSK